MAYRDELKAFKEESAKHRKNILFIIKLTVVIFAVFAVLTTVFLIVDIVKDSSNTPVGSSSGDGSGSKAPTVTLADGLDAIYVYVGENVSWKTKVKLSTGATFASVDTSNVDLDTTGVYTVTYVAQNGKKTTSLSVKVVVNKKEYSYDTLKGLIEAKVKNLGITSAMSKREQVRTIYEYVHDKNNISYDKTGSNIPNINRNNWETDWVEEAIRTFSKGSGDCYSYYSVSKAFFEYLEIENVGIQRDNSNIPSKEGTHFWFIVNVGTTSAQWYYYDATRLNGKFKSDGSDDACLITLKKLQSYEPSTSLSYDFYEFDPTKYPTAATN